MNMCCIPNKLRILTGIMVIVIPLSSLMFAQEKTSKPDTTKIEADTTKNITKLDSNVKSNEIELIEITIEAEIEKPRVAILPKRIEPELGEMEFIDRSFEKELKQGPRQPFLIEKKRELPVGIKQIIENKKKDNEN